MRAALVVGARPNFMKIAPLMREFKGRNVETLLIHTGQHYDKNMSKVFFEDLELPEPDIYLGVGSGSHAEQTARVMIAFEEIVLSKNPDIIIVVGDVNSTVACSLVGAKLHVPVAHVESGLRSFDLDMPEEINRMVTDILSKYCFTTSPEAETNLRKEGVGGDRIFFVGNIMIDSLLYYMKKSEDSPILEDLGLEKGEYILVTLHRPSNVDSPEELRSLFDMLNRLSGKLPVVFPVHPRTKKMIDTANPPFKISSDFKMIDPVGYLDFLKAMRNAKMVITDSGGIQEETTVLGVPCITVRNNTERPITIDVGTNVLAGTDPVKVEYEALKILEKGIGEHGIPPLWDGKTAGRIADVLLKYFD
ncbi:MAG: UDP-N-acetylglucosamine 2-epimerase (non-hydrolyzing) [Candidatus Krumholzibacteriota bacterium]|nr:UDP-N-acetylglucosamine 2-epimerase (non-hydrolyzing) [Candidatus Krumholzibacteriota bacterium]